MSVHDLADIIRSAEHVIIIREGYKIALGPEIQEALANVLDESQPTEVLGYPGTFFSK